MSEISDISKHEAQFAQSLQATQKVSAENATEMKENQQDASLDSLQGEAAESSAMGIQIRTQRLVGKEEVKKPEKAQRAQESVLVRIPAMRRPRSRPIVHIT